MVVFHCVIGGTLIWNKLYMERDLLSVFAKFFSSPIFFEAPDGTSLLLKGPVKEKQFPYLIEKAAKAVLGGMAKHQMKLEEYTSKLIKVIGR